MEECRAQRIVNRERVECYQTVTSALAGAGSGGLAEIHDLIDMTDRPSHGRVTTPCLSCYNLATSIAAHRAGTGPDLTGRVWLRCVDTACHAFVT